MPPLRVKLLSPWFNKENFHRFLPQGDVQGVSFSCDPALRDYDWLVVYDEVPRFHPVEERACPAEQTILVTQEPPNIKLYPPFYTHQFNYILTTHDAEYIRHPHWRRGEGCFIWLDGRPFDEQAAAAVPDKTRGLSAVHSAKQMKHTDHYHRYQLLRYLEGHLDDFDWYGYGVQKLERKCDALTPYAYHLVIENYREPYHWSEKIADALMHHCLPFYAGDPHLDELLPEGCFIRIPLEDHAEAARIIREAMENDEYSKRLPAICAARELLLSKHNLASQIIKTIREHESSALTDWVPRGARIVRRHKLRKNPLHALAAAWHQLRCWLLNKKRG